MNDSEKIWEKQPFETNLQYTYFHQYMLMNYEIKANDSDGNEILKTSVNPKRSIRLLAKKLKKNYSNIAKMSTKNEWQKRTEAFDLYMLNEIKSRREREYLEAQDRYSEMGKTIFAGIAKSLEAINWEKLKPFEMEKLAKVAHAFELGEESKNYNGTQTDESNAGTLDSDARERMEKIYKDCASKPVFPKKIKKIKQLPAEE